MSPKVLLVTSCWWLVSARLAMALAQAGCTVAAVCPPGHPFGRVRCIQRCYRVRRIGSRHSVLAAIRDAAPDYIIPCDDRAVMQLHELHSLHPPLRKLIERSLGDPCGYAAAASRDALQSLAPQLGIRMPEGGVVSGEDIAVEWATRHAAGVVLKLDGTHSGDGVRIVRTAGEAAAAYRQLRAATTLRSALTGMVVRGDPLALWSWNRRARAGVTVQRYVPGVPANMMVACLNGEIAGHVAVEVVSAERETGASTVVRVIRNDEMLQAATRIARRLGMSGFFGLDFILEQGTGTPWLIEMNPRSTQLAHLPFAQTGDLAGILYGQWTGCRPAPPQHTVQGDTIAFYPRGMVSDAGRYWDCAYQDVPREEPALMDDALLPPWPNRRFIARAYRRLERHLFRVA